MTKGVRQKLTIRATDRQVFVDTIMELALKGAKRVRNSVPRFVVPFTCDMEIYHENDAQAFKSTAVMIAYPVEYETFTEAQLEIMVWEEFREAVAKMGVKGRDRKKMTEDYMTAIKNKR